MLFGHFQAIFFQIQICTIKSLNFVLILHIFVSILYLMKCLKSNF